MRLPNIAFVAQKAFPHWNKRVITEREVRNVCKKKGIVIAEGKVGVPGLYLIYKGIPFIVIDPDLSPSMRLWVLIHELAHHLLHVPGLQLFDAYYVTKADYEANFIAAVCLMPLPMISTKLPWEIQDEYGYSSDLISLRKTIYETHKI